MRVDIIGLSEVNVNWKWVGSAKRLEARTKGWFEGCRTTSASFESYKGNQAAHLYGGTSIWSLNKMSTRVDFQMTIKDPLGRWCGHGYRGRNGAVLVAIVAYRPVVNKDGPTSVWNQQRVYYLEKAMAEHKTMAEDPIKQFDLDLLQVIRRLQDQNYHIVLGIDANEDLANRSSPFRLKMEAAGLCETILQQHGAGPPTMNRGSTKIDGLFVSTSLQGLKCGYTGYIHDHTGLFVDIPMHLALGHAIPPVIRPAMRRLKIQDPRTVTAYLTSYKVFLEAEKIAPAMNQIWKAASVRYDPRSIENCLFEWEQELFERLDARCTAGMLEAERTCRKLFLGSVPWSPDFLALQQYQKLLYTLLRRRQGKQVSLKTVALQAVRANKREALGWKRSKLKGMLRQVNSSIKEFKGQLASQARRTHNEKLVESIAASKGIEATKVVQTLMKREEMRAHARTIRTALKPSHSGAVSMVQSRDEQGELVTQTSKAAMEKAIMAECSARFRQASNTDFLSAPLYARVGPLGVSEFCDRALAGKLKAEDWEEVSPYARKLLRELQRPPPLRDKFCNWVPDLEAFQYGWKIQKESTGAYPGRHFGHMMSNVQDPKVAELHRQLEYLPMMTGKAPPSWRKAIDVMIEKKAGVYQVDKLRAICLFDPVANHSFKYLGKEMMRLAETDGLLAKEQGGSRRGHRANYIGLEKRLSFDMSRQLRRPLALCSNDARACYDRIVHSVAALSLQRVGVPKPAVICMFSTIQDLEHKVRTIYGDSESHFGGEQDRSLYSVPVSTIGQGNGAGPQIWAIVSTPLLNMLRSEGLMMAYRSALSGNKSDFVGIAFVDDTDLGICAEHLTEPEHVVAEMQRSLNHWEGGLNATGGAIAPEKTFWHLLAYKWHADGSWSLQSEEDCPATLSVRDMHGALQQIQRYPTNHAERTLGIYLAPDGSDQQQELVLYNKSVAWAGRLRGSHLPRQLALTAYKTTIDKGFSYPLVATCLSFKQCQHIQSPAMTAALQASGVGRDMPLVVRTGPIKFQGLGLPDVYTTQLYHHLEALAFASENPLRNTSQLLWLSAEQLKLELGVNGPLFDVDMERVSSTTKSWISFTGRECARHSIQMLDSLPEFVPRREGDQLLMEAFRKNPRLSPTTLGILSRCRIYLQVLYLSDIVTCDGAVFTEFAWHGKRDPSRNSEYCWPVQGRPSERCWKLWQETLGSQWCTQGRSLRQQLGHWDAAETTTRFFFSPRLDRLLEKTALGWFQYGYSGSGRRRRVRVFTKLLWAQAIPADLQRASVEIVSPTVVRLGSRGASFTACAAIPSNTLESMRQKLPESSRWILEYVALPADEGQCIAEAIKSGEAIAVSDGSFEPVLQTGAAAMTIQGPTAANAIFAQCLTPGQKSDQSAYRSELIGLYQTIVLVHLLSIQHQVTEGSIELACDGLSALKQATKVKATTPLSQSHFDIISACKQVMRETPITWKTRHVLGHQRERGGVEGTRLVGPLDRWASLNDDMDEAAKLHRVLYADRATGPMPQFLFREMSPILVRGIKLCSNVQEAIYEQVNGPPLLAYWRSKGKFGELTDASVDWNATYKAMKMLPAPRRQHQTKMVSKFVAVRYRTKMRHDSTENTCPTCLTQPVPVAAIETVDHLYRCPSATSVWTERLEALNEYLSQQGTERTIRRAIVKNLQAWRNDLPYPTSSNEATQALAEAQLHLGWHAAFEGRFAIGWAVAQERHYRITNAKPYHNGLRWLSQLIRKLFEISWDLWEHRNNELHKRESGIKIVETRRLVAEEFAVGHENIPRLRHLMKPGLACIQQRPLSQLQAWLHLIQAERELRENETQDDTWTRRGQCLMRNYFQPRNQHQYHQQQTTTEHT